MSDTKLISIDDTQNVQVASNLNITGGLTLPNIPLTATNGGTGFNLYSIGDMLIANSATTLTKINMPVQAGQFLSTNASGIAWSNSLLATYIDFGQVISNSNTSYNLSYLIGYNSTGSNIISIGNTAVNLATSGLNGLAQSGTLTGVLSPKSMTTTITGVGTLFSSDLRVGDSIQCNSQNRTVISITNNTSITIDETFTLLNQWTLVNGAILTTSKFKFGTHGLSSPSSGDYALLTLGSLYGVNTSNPWTLEFFVNMNNNSSNRTVCSTIATAFSIEFRNSTSQFALDLSSYGTSYDISNTQLITTTISANTWYHIAIVYNGSTYKAFINGLLGLTVVSSTPVLANGFAQMKVGAPESTLLNASIDEFRISNIARYSINFTPTTSAFVLDSNTISLNHFEASTVNDSDDIITRTFSYNRGGIASRRVYYCYALNHSTTPGYLVSRDSTTATLRNIPTGYSSSDIRQMPIYWIGNSNRIVCTTSKMGHQYAITPSIVLVSASSSTTPIISSLVDMIPSSCQMIKLLITHDHAGTISANVLVNSVPYLTCSNAGTIYLTIDIFVGTSQLLTTYLSTTASSTTYSIELIGFYV